MYKVGTITQVLNSLFQGCNLLVVLLIKSFTTTNIKNDNSEVKLINQLAQLILVEFGDLVKVVYNGALRWLIEVILFSNAYKITASEDTSNHKFAMLIDQRIESQPVYCAKGLREQVA